MNKKTTYEIGLLLKPVKGQKEWKPVLTVTKNSFIELAYIETIGL